MEQQATDSTPTPRVEAAESAPRFRRRQKLVKPGIQLRLAGVFAGLSVLALMVQWLLFSSILTNAANRMPVGGEYLLDLMPTLLLRSVLFSLGVVLPLTMMAGIQATFRLTGPIYRFESYLRGVLQKTQLGPCKIRDGDALNELCGLINEVTEPLRRRTAETGQDKQSEVA